MSFAAVGLSLGLTAFLCASLLGSLFSVSLWRLLEPRRPRTLFALRLLPGVAGLLLTGGLFVPAFWTLEPRESGESVGWPLLLPAALAAALIAAGAARGWTAFLATRRLLREWSARARPVSLPGAAVPAYSMSHPFPVVSVVGVLRPRLFVARRVLEALTAEELEAVVAHEAGHLAAHDNLRALLLRTCADPLSLLPAGERLRRAWSQAAEFAADDHAARAEAPRALVLAEALLKVGRLAPAGARVSLPVSALHDGEGLAPRVDRLVARVASGTAAVAEPEHADLAAWSVMLGLAAALVALAARPETLRAVHGAAELALRILN